MARIAEALDGQGRDTRAYLVCTALAGLLPAFGCWESYRIEATSDAPADRSDASDTRDGEAAADAETVADARPDWTVDSGFDGWFDGGDHDPVCPAALPTAGLGRLTLRWRRRLDPAWTTDGSPILAVRDGVVLVVLPAGPPGGPTGDRAVLERLDPADGEHLPGSADDVYALRNCSALASATATDGATWAVGAFGPNPTIRFVTGRLTASGELVDGREVQVEPRTVWLDESGVTELRAAAAGGRLYLAAEGTSTSPGRPSWLLHAALLPLDGTPADGWLLADAWSDQGDPFVAWGGAGGAVESVAWTQPSAIDLRTPTGSNLSAHRLPVPSPQYPIAAVQAADGYRYLTAGRSATADGELLWLEEREPSRLELVGASDLRVLEDVVSHPEPRALVATGNAAVLAWTARRDEIPARLPFPACLYLTPLASDGNPDGISLRLDPGAEFAPGPPGIEHVRIEVAPDGLFVLWRQEGAAWVARIEWSS